MPDSADTQARSSFESDGYAVARGLFSGEEAEEYIEHFMRLRAGGDRPGDFSGVAANEADPLKAYPRMIHMHRWDDLSLRWLIDARIRTWLRRLTGLEPYAVQTMLYFKPAGSRGQALHQDQFYLKARPGTCLAAWMALDRCDEENGCLQVVPGTRELPILCTEPADTSASFTDVTVPLPDGMEPVPIILDPGDVLFFNGNVVHGSLPNTSTDRFRRSLIGHYLAGDVREVATSSTPSWIWTGMRWF